MARKSKKAQPTDGQIIATLIATAAVGGVTLWAAKAALSAVAKVVSKGSK